MKMNYCTCGLSLLEEKNLHPTFATYLALLSTSLQTKNQEKISCSAKKDLVPEQAKEEMEMILKKDGIDQRSRLSFYIGKNLADTKNVCFRTKDDYPNKEMILVDNGSEDSLEEIG